MHVDREPGRILASEPYPSDSERSKRQRRPSERAKASSSSENYCVAPSKDQWPRQRVMSLPLGAAATRISILPPLFSQWPAGHVGGTALREALSMGDHHAGKERYAKLKVTIPLKK